MPYTTGADWKVEVVGSPSSPLAIEGEVADGASLSGVNPVLVAGQDGTLVQSLLTDSTGRQVVVGAAADGAAVAGNPVLVAGQDGTNAQSWLMDSTGVGGVALKGGSTALADAATNSPVIPVTLGGSGLFVPALGYGFNSSTWDRLRTVNGATGTTGTGLLGAALMGFDQTNYHRCLIGSSDNVSTATVLNVVPVLGNGTTFDRARGNMEQTILASASRATTTSSSDQTNYSGRGVYLYLNVTVNPGGAETLTLNVQIKDPVSGTYLTVYSTGALTTFGGGATGMEVIMLYPGISEASAIANSAPQPIALPRTWRVNIVHSAGGSWTYSVGGHVIK